MNVVNINNTSVYIHKYMNITYKTEISLDENEFLIVAFNEDSTLYSYGDGAKTKHPLIPYANNMWYIGTYGKYGSGVGELKTR